MLSPTLPEPKRTKLQQRARRDAQASDKSSASLTAPAPAVTNNNSWMGASISEPRSAKAWRFAMALPSSSVRSDIASQQLRVTPTTRLAAILAFTKLSTNSASPVKPIPSRAATAVPSAAESIAGTNSRRASTFSAKPNAPLAASTTSDAAPDSANFRSWPCKASSSIVASSAATFSWMACKWFRCLTSASEYLLARSVFTLSRCNTA
mmetsp:Transcript_117322/g.292520  ORF Transcript_117322/g.292520 Transcript_117322/m.292520 type:complete len:208 (+) Transcript_117322:348-971(+)